MTGNEAVQSSTYPVVLPNPTVNSVQDFQTAPSWFKNRFQAIGYYLDPSATTGTYSGPSTAMAAETGVRTVTAVITTVITRAASADRQGLPAGGVAGVAVGSVVAGVLVGAAMVWGLFRRKAGGSGGDTRPMWARTGEVENKPPPSEMAVGFSGTELEDTSPMKGASAGKWA
jgi:tetrahydromethanopterin S-methyltransferase subunit F